MIHMIADDTPLSVLSSLVEPVAIYDATGTQVIGHYTPVDLERGKRLYAELASRIDPEEIARRKASGEKGRPLSEVLEALRASEALPAAAASDGSTSIPSGRDECATP
jgi:hypothetical protein